MNGRIWVVAAEKDQAGRRAAAKAGTAPVWDVGAVADALSRLRCGLAERAAWASLADAAKRCPASPLAGLTSRESACVASWAGLAAPDVAARRAHAAATAAEGSLSGHALFRALVNAHGSEAAQHTAAARRVAEQALESTGLLDTHRPNFRSGPLKWYGASR